MRDIIAPKNNIARTAILKVSDVILTIIPQTVAHASEVYAKRARIKPRKENNHPRHFM